MYIEIDRNIDTNIDMNTDIDIAGPSHVKARTNV